MSMLRRLFHSPGTTGFYSPDPFWASRLEAGYTKLRGRAVCPEKEETGSVGHPLPYNLRFSTGDCMVFLSQVHNWSFLLRDQARKCGSDAWHRSWCIIPGEIIALN